MVLVGASAVEDLAHKTQDVDCGDYDARTGYDGPYAVECIGMLERTVEVSLFGNETAEARLTEVGKTGNDVGYCKERHYLHQPVKLAYVTCVCTSVNHTDECKE